MAIIMESQNGALTYWTNHGLLATDFQRSPPEIRTYNKESQGRPGNHNYGDDYGTATITVPFEFEAYDLLDFPLKRDEVISLLAGKKPFYLYEGVTDGNGYQFERPGEQPYEDEAGNPRPFNVYRDLEFDYIYGKRYYVRRVDMSEIEQQGRVGKGSITYETVGLPFGESAATTKTPLVIGDSGDAKEDNIWTLGGAEIFRDLEYTHDNPSRFNVYNGGDEPVEAEYSFFEITFTGPSSNLRIYNHTNGTEWQYNGSSGNSDTITIRGIQSSKNEQTIVEDTNLEFIILEPGDNDIEVTGAGSGSQITFDFRFYYR